MSWELAGALVALSVGTAAVLLGLILMAQLSELRRRWERNSEMLWDENKKIWDQIQIHKMTLNNLQRVHEKYDRDLTGAYALLKNLKHKTERDPS